MSVLRDSPRCLWGKTPAQDRTRGRAGGGLPGPDLSPPPGRRLAMSRQSGPDEAISSARSRSGPRRRPRTRCPVSGWFWGVCRLRILSTSDLDPPATIFRPRRSAPAAGAGPGGCGFPALDLFALVGSCPSLGYRVALALVRGQRSLVGSLLVVRSAGDRAVGTGKRCHLYRPSAPDDRTGGGWGGCRAPRGVSGNAGNVGVCGVWVDLILLCAYFVCFVLTWGVRFYTQRMVTWSSA